MTTPPSPKDQPILITTGKDLLDQGKIPAALDSFRQALDHANTEENQFAIAQLLHREGHPRAVLEVIGPYYRVDSAPLELKLILLRSSMAIKDRSLAGWFISQLENSPEPAAVSAVALARRYLATLDNTQDSYSSQSSIPGRIQPSSDSWHYPPTANEAT
jgi:hypothetical protein